MIEYPLGINELDRERIAPNGSIQRPAWPNGLGKTGPTGLPGRAPVLAQ
jgi:hypothetical protein